MTSAPANAPAATHPTRGPVAGGVVLLAFGIATSLVGSAILVAGIVAGGVNQAQDEEGFFSTPTESFATDTYALTSPAIARFTVDRGVQDLPVDLATIRLRATSADADIFIGIASRTAIESYLRNVERTEIREIRYSPFHVEYRDLDGSGTPAPPASMGIWVASASGTGTQELEWTIASGDWGVVVMNADGTAGVDVDMQAGVRSDLIGPAATGLLITGTILLLVGIAMLAVGATILSRRGGRPSGSSGSPAAPFDSQVQAAGSAPQQ